MSQSPTPAHRIPTKTPLLVQQEQEQAQQKKRVRVAAVAGAVCGLAMVSGIAIFLFSGNALVSVAESSQPAPPTAMPDTDETARGETATTETPPAPAAAVALVAPAPEAIEDATPPPEPVASDAPEPESPSLQWSPLDVDPRVVAFKFPQLVWLSAYDATSGRLAINDDANSRIVFYDIEALRTGKVEPAASIATAGPPSAIVYKNFKDRRILLAAGKDAPKIGIFDADTLKPIKDVSIDDRGFARLLLASADPDDPYVFYSVGFLPGERRSGKQGKVKATGRLDVRTLEREANFQLYDNESTYDAALAADGQLLYFRSSLREHAVHRWRNASYDGSRRDRLIERHGDVGAYFPDLYGNAVYESTRVHSRDMIGDATLTLEYEPKVQFDQRPVLVGMKFNELVFASANDYRELATITLPEDWFPSKNPQVRDRQRLPSDFRRRADIARNDPGFLNLFVDDGRGLAILTLMNQLVIVPLAALNLPQEPNLRPTNGVPLNQYVGEESLLPLEAAPDAKFEIVKFTGKSTPRIEGNRLRWTPEPQDVGRQVLRLRATHGAALHEWEWPFHVGYRPIDVPFDVEGLTMEPMHRVRAVVWGQLRAPTPEDVDRRRYFIGVVDFKRGELLAHRELERKVFTASMSSSHVYLSPDGATQQTVGRHTAAQLVKLALPSLETEDQVVCRVDYSGPQLIDEKYLAAGVASSERFILPDLKPLPAVWLDRGDRLLYRRVGIGWVWDSVLYDEEFSRPQLILPSPESQDYHVFLSWPELNPATYDFPEPIALDERGQFHTVVPYNGAMNAQEKKPQVLLQLTYLPALSHSPPGQRLAWGDDFFATLFGGKLYRVPFADFNVPQRQSPKLTFKQSAMLLEMARPTRVEYEARGADRVRLSLTYPRTQQTFFEDEVRNGKFTIPAFGKEQQRAFVYGAVEELKRYQGDRQQKQTGSDMLQAYLTEGATRYARVIGREPSGVLVPIQAKVTAETDAGESTSMTHLYLVEVPARALREQLQQLETQIR